MATINATKVVMQLNMIQQTDDAEHNLCTLQCLVSDKTLKDMIEKKKFGAITFLLPEGVIDDNKQ